MKNVNWKFWLAVIVVSVAVYLLWSPVIWPILSFLGKWIGVIIIGALLLVGIIVSWAQIMVIIVALPAKIVSALFRLMFFFVPVFALIAWDYQYTNQLLSFLQIEDPLLTSSIAKTIFALVVGVLFSGFSLVNVKSSSSSDSSSE